MTKKFRDYKIKENNAQYITFFDSEYYPDYLEAALQVYKPVFEQFGELLEEAENSSNLLELIGKESNPIRTQLMRVFRKFVSPDTSVEMLKKKTKIPEIIRDFGDRFRELELVRERYNSRPFPDETLAAMFFEYANRGEKGYLLTEAFFNWFEEKFGDEYEILGPIKAGRDIILSEYLEGFSNKVPADFLIRNKNTKEPKVVGFARYDSDRGGSQEDDRIKGNRDNVTEMIKYSRDTNKTLKVLLLNDGPGLTLGSMWDDYSSLEDYGEENVRVVTLKMLEERVTKDWIEE
ncbi:hypothetical protein BN1058_00111 [Paraliobacillus sp. PM-2]|uniref:hypothetical protein n=1 Tax=Paraliobacillus sp. PM-2 TaxID=1462524 RepID=UPI00061BAB3E|nr:hypothetical protein [Paraliobacillus sp. PM-2]CQR45871.1 hypothetical protein BN1058_00111 [Paraliobacillus sp. PM-2]